VRGPSEKLSVVEVKEAIAKTKNNKTAGLSRAVSKMLKASGEPAPQWVPDVCNAVLKHGKILEAWSNS